MAKDLKIFLPSVLRHVGIGTENWRMEHYTLTQNKYKISSNEMDKILLKYKYACSCYNLTAVLW